MPSGGVHPISFGCFLLFDHNWAVWSAKKRHYEIFGDHVIPHFKKTNRRLKLSEQTTRDVREELAAQQQQAIKSFIDKHGANAKTP